MEQGIRSRLSEQNQQGIAFFNMNDTGFEVDNGYPEIVDLRLIMDPTDKAKISGQERGFEIYSPFISAAITAYDEPNNVLANLTSGGRIRPKGQSTMYLGTCMNRTTPYQVDWNYVNANQTLFGMERSYLRTSWGDPSFTREWAMHRMLARFKLPFLKTRSVRLFINNENYGLYSLMEAPDQNYVFQRSFPNFNIGR